ncbi:hypothetical protein SAMN04487849_1057 [Micrococcus luteus]|uniref:Uncharacterized protein n=1 Tax=Micrococcus luteus TaxID=1270 RepID=A0ABD7M756_MICLU|nr:hypothetical protein SAMN04487849_1057 [Micrococcus luteus]
MRHPFDYVPSKPPYVDDWKASQAAVLAEIAAHI